MKKQIALILAIVYTQVTLCIDHIYLRITNNSSDTLYIRLESWQLDPKTLWTDDESYTDEYTIDELFEYLEAAAQANPKGLEHRTIMQPHESRQPTNIFNNTFNKLFIENQCNKFFIDEDENVQEVHAIWDGETFRLERKSL